MGSCVFFFFQAEDGIRDGRVTGVQTCALPISHSISAGLDYPGIGPEHSWLHEIGRVNYLSATDDEALAAFQLLSRLEGIIPALEPAHAIAKVMELAPKRPRDHLMVVNLSGRGDKDIPQVADILRGKKK